MVVPSILAFDKQVPSSRNKDFGEAKVREDFDKAFSQIWRPGLCDTTSYLHDSLNLNV